VTGVVSAIVVASATDVATRVVGATEDDEDEDEGDESSLHAARTPSNTMVIAATRLTWS
jgi:hypothetical protein